LQAKRAEIQRRAAFGLTVNAALVRLAKLRALWLQHDLRPRTSSGARARALGLAPATATAFLHIKGAPLRGHRIVLHDLALVDPDLDTDDAVGRLRQAVAEIDVCAQRVQRHSALTIPLRTGDLRPAEAARNVDTNPLGTEAQCRLHGALHGPAEGDAPLKLLGDALSHQSRINLGLAHLDDVQVHLGRRQLRQISAHLLDVGALLADQNTRPSRVDRHTALLVRPLDHDLGNPGLALLLHDVLADRAILMQQLAVLAAISEPAAVPGPVDADAEADWIDFLTHSSGLLCLRRFLLHLAHDDGDLRERLQNHGAATAAAG